MTNFIKYFIKRLWGSATFTQYGNYISTLGAALFVLPIVLSKFGEIEIAIWLLISSVNLFASILSSRLQITFVRVVAFAFAGARDYQPIINHGEKRGDGNPNWEGLQNIFATLSKTFFYVAFFTLFVVVLGLSFGIYNLVDGFSISHISLILIVGLSVLFTQNFKKYNVFLIGFNEVALVNRWNTLFGVINIIGAFIILIINGELMGLVAWQMFVPIISSLRDKWLFNSYLYKRAVPNKGNFDKEILLAVKEPLWKGLVANASQMGMVQFSGIIFTTYGEPAIVASYLFSLRIIKMLAEFAQVPFNSKQPYFSKLRSEGEIDKLANVYTIRIALALATYVIGVIVVLLFNDYFLKLINSNVSFVSKEIWLLMGLLYGIERINIFYFAILASANQIVMHKEQVLATLLALGTVLFIIGDFGLTGLILAVWVPRIIVFNIKPLKLASHSLNMDPKNLFMKTYIYLIIIIFTMLL